MIFKRKELFRYIFSTAVPCKLLFFEQSDKNEERTQANGLMYDLSPKGLSLKTPFHLKHIKDIRVEITFALMDESKIVSGNIIWKKQVGPQTFHYGVYLHTSKDEEKWIVEELKKHVKKYRDEKLEKPEGKVK